jgi:hypothetical protein
MNRLGYGFGYVRNNPMQYKIMTFLFNPFADPLAAFIFFHGTCAGYGNNSHV